MLIYIFFLSSGFLSSSGFQGCPYSSKQFYNTYYGTPISKEQLRQYDKRNVTLWCAVEVASCCPHEGRRLDGSCINLAAPSRGATHTPFGRVLPAEYGPDFEPRLSKSGAPLPLARQLRTTLLAEGRVPSHRYTHLFTNYAVFMAADIASVQDTINYVLWTPYCCTPRGKNDSMCVPNKIPVLDPVHRFSGQQCLNMTRPISFQSSGCLPNNTLPERINTATNLLDLSTIYGSILNLSLANGRLFEGGLLKYEIEDGKVWPPSANPKNNLCLLNQKPFETRCHATPDDGTNSLLGINLFSIWFWRLHNQIARKLSSLNPCWGDERLFQTARDINIAIAMQIYYYELLPDFMGRENLLRVNLISPSPGFRDLYNENLFPQMSLEYPYVLRWVHLIQEGNLKMYDKQGNHLRDFPIVNLTLRTGFLAVNQHLEQLTQGSFRQASSALDYIVDPDIAEQGLGPHQYVSDITTNDLAKGRFFGLPPYIRYREHCFGTRVKSWEDLYRFIDLERIELLKELYDHVEDVDLLAGIWVEKPIQGGFVPPTFFCLVVDQLLRNVASDRHWYERPNRPQAFNIEQLLEIRKITVARLLCDVGDSVTEIQPRAFRRKSYRNRFVSCEKIPQINFNVWKDLSCESHN